MDQFTRRIVGFAVHRGVVDGVALCQMFNRAIRTQTLPKYLSSDHDPLYRFHQWEANLRVLDVKEIKTVPYVPLSHRFVERLIGTIRREFLDQTLFWTAADLEDKLQAFQRYFNKHRTHLGLERRLPEPGEEKVTLNFASYRWKQWWRDFHEFATNRHGATRCLRNATVHSDAWSACIVEGIRIGVVPDQRGIKLRSLSGIRIDWGSSRKLIHLRERNLPYNLRLRRDFRGKRYRQQQGKNNH